MLKSTGFVTSPWSRLIARISTCKALALNLLDRVPTGMGMVTVGIGISFPLAASLLTSVWPGQGRTEAGEHGRRQSW